MYRVVRASILYFDDHMKSSHARHKLIEPMMLLTDSKKFNDAKETMSHQYLFLCDIINEIRRLYLTGDARYHHFGMLLGELQVLGFDVDSMERANRTPDDILKDRIDLLLQFLAYKYPFDSYDNKIGVHDPVTNSFIFSQP